MAKTTIILQQEKTLNHFQFNLCVHLTDVITMVLSVSQGQMIIEAVYNSRSVIAPANCCPKNYIHCFSKCYQLNK